MKPCESCKELAARIKDLEAERAHRRPIYNDLATFKEKLKAYVDSLPALRP
jgi:hypothetical protein